MREYKRMLWQPELEALFDESNRKDVQDWLVASEGRLRVVLVGAGFTRNARTRSGRPVTEAAPLWSHVAQTLANDLGSTSTIDAPTLADFYLDRLGGTALHDRMLELQDDDDLIPGEAHTALLDSRAHAIVTTNLFDTVLEKYNSSRWTRVVTDVDLAMINHQQPDTVPSQLIYFHGHRSNFDSWVLARSQYEDVARTRPLIVARVRQLFAQFPLLVVGYSLDDPDFHALYRDTARSMMGRQPLGLALLHKADPYKATYWRRLGLRTASFKGG